MIPRNANDGNQILLFGNTLNRSGGMGSRNLPSVPFPVLITREVKKHWSCITLLLLGDLGLLVYFSMAAQDSTEQRAAV